jgi:hypothetical protein
MANMAMAFERAQGSDPVIASLSTRTVVFGHQSVGANVLDGVADLVASGRAGLKVAALEDAAGPGLYHVRIGSNGSPDAKLADFERLAGEAPADSIVAMKFCYVDVRPGAVAETLFDAYRGTVARVRAARPDLRVVHITLPLTADRGWLFHLRTVVRGRTSTRELNAIRGRYNELLRSTFKGEPIFDLAALESTDVAGRAVLVSFGGADVPVLAREWTYDGGHLNEAGRRRIAEAFLSVLAAA